MIPFYTVSQTGGKIYQVDDATGVNDLMALDGTGGSAFTPYILSTTLQARNTEGFYTIRKVRQRFDAFGGAATISITPWRDGRDTGQTITKTFPTGSVGVTTTPLFYSGSGFQVKIALSGFAGPVELANGNVALVPRRSSRGESAMG